jgi:hypothetical protein
LSVRKEIAMEAKALRIHDGGSGIRDEDAKLVSGPGML